MKYSSQIISLFDTPLSQLPKDNRWVKLGDSLPWDKLEKAYNKKLHNAQTGAGNKPARMVIGALIVKHRLGLSDTDTIETIRENPYMQYMLGLSEFTTAKVFDPSLFVTIRKRLGVEDINGFTKMLMDASEDRSDHDGDCEQPATHQGTLKVDATCCDAEVRYPTDLDLLHDGFRVVERVLDRFCDKANLKRPRTDWETAHRLYSSVIKKKVKSKKLLSSCMERMVHLLSKSISVTINTIAKMPIGLTLWLKRRDADAFGSTIRMLWQQKDMLERRVHQCKDRIISIFQPHVRPIVRGKNKAKVEFGAKIGASIVNGYTFIDHHSWDAYNESEDLLTHLRKYKMRFGCLPRLFEGDKIYLNRRNRRILKMLKIEIGGKPLGRPPKETEVSDAKMSQYIGERNEIEATFGTAKRVYRANNIRAKLPDTGASWAALCFFAKNVEKFLREFLFALLRFRLLWLCVPTHSSSSLVKHKLPV